MPRTFDFATTGQERGRDETADARGRKQGREGGEREAAALSDLEHEASRHESDEHAELAEPIPLREIRRAHPFRDERSHPTIPGGRPCHARRPVDARGSQQLPEFGVADEGPADKRQETERLHGGARDAPAAVGAEAAHGVGRDQLEECPCEHWNAGHHASGDRAQAERQREGRDVGFAATDHHAEGHGVGRRYPKVAAQGPGRQKRMQQRSNQA